MIILIAGLALFLGVHLVKVAAPEWRKARIAAMGEGPWKAVYSLLSIIGLVLIVWGFARANGTIGFLYTPPEWGRHVTYVLVLLSFILIAASNFPAGRIKPAVRNPMLLGTILWAAGHLFVRGNVVSVALFGAFLVWAVADWASVRKRRLAGIENGPKPGPVKWDIFSIAAGLAAYLLFLVYLHEWLIGVVPMP